MTCFVSISWITKALERVYHGEELVQIDWFHYSIINTPVALMLLSAEASRHLSALKLDAHWIIAAI